MPHPIHWPGTLLMGCHLHTRMVSSQIILDSLPETLSPVAVTAPGQSWFCHSTQQVLTKIKQCDLGSRDSLVTTQKPKKLLRSPALTTLGLQNRDEGQCSFARYLLNEEAYELSLDNWGQAGKGPFWRELHVLEI